MRRISLFACAVIGASLVAGQPVRAQDHMPQGHGQGKAQGIEVAHGWARATPGSARAGAAYVTIHNLGDRKDRLTGAETPVAARAQLHRHVMEGTVMRMRHVEGGIAIAPGKEIAFKPGGYHIMLMGLKKPLKEGETFPLTLIFEHAGRKTAEIDVRGIAAMGPGNGQDHGEGHGGH